MAYYALLMLVIALELAEENDVYDDMVVKFVEQFAADRAVRSTPGSLRPPRTASSTTGSPSPTA